MGGGEQTKMSFEVLKALSNIIASTPKEAEKIAETIERTLHKHPELEQPFKEYLKSCVDLSNFVEIDKHGTIKFRLR